MDTLADAMVITAKKIAHKKAGCLGKRVHVFVVGWGDPEDFCELL